MDAAQLPDLDSLDREALLALLFAHQEELRSLAASHEDQLRSLQAELESHRQTLSQQDEQLRSRSEQIEHLKLMIEKLRRAMFGRKSEKIVVQLEQLELHLEELESAQAEMEMAIEAVTPAAEVKPRSPRKPLPEHLPREVVTHLPQGDCCSGCGGALRKFGEDVSEQLEYIPESFKVIRHMRPKFACSGCDRVVEAPRHPGPSSADLPDQVCWLMCWCRSMPTTCPCIVSRRFMRGRAWRSSDPRWPVGWARPVSY
jgi:transposase